MHIAVIGGGFVGKATASISSQGINVFIYDIDKSKCSPQDVNITLDDVLDPLIDIIFICLPTPYDPQTGICLTSIIDDFLKNLLQLGKSKNMLKETILKKIVMRSTVPPTLCEYHNISNMPEFLTEKNPIGTFKQTNIWIVGLSDNGQNEYIKQKISSMINLAYSNNVIESNKLFFCNTRESALIKLGRNSFLATKVSFFNELYDISESFNVDPSIVSCGIGLDPRIGLSHTLVPGHDCFRGFGGICFPKDLNNLITSAKENNVNPIILSAVNERNKIDRPESAKSIDIIEGRSIINKN